MKPLMQLKKLNLVGIPKATAEATIAYVRSLESELTKIKRLKAQGKLLELCAPVGATYYITCPYFTCHTDCKVCSHTCGEITTTPEQKIFTSVDEILALQSKLGIVVFLVRSDATKSKTKKIYIPRNQLTEGRLQQLRQNDKAYYWLHKELVNQKDRDKYHQLHPNAKYYKKRTPAHQISMEELLDDIRTNS